MKLRIFLFSVALLISGCTLGPNYQRPTVAVPGSYRGTISDETAQKQLAPLGDQKWWDIFQDEQLRMLIRTALAQNYDLRIAASRMLEAQAQLGIIRADQFPALGAGAGIADVREAKSKFLPASETSTGRANLSAAWELDFWGKYRRATEAGRANLLASEWARREVVSTLVADVASAYFQLRALDLQLEIAKRTLNSRQESLRLTRILSDGGSTSLLDVRQAEQLVFTASAEIPALEQQIEQQENFLSILLGQNPGDVSRGQTLTEQRQPPEVPPGLPSSLLERRPDIRRAEAQLVAANAEIGVARAAYFPQISLSGAGGFQSSALSSLFSGPAGAWSLGASLTQPIFTGGRRYTGGVTGYLEVLTNETNAFSAELGLVQARLNELLALVQLYQALGGGWQQ